MGDVAKAGGGAFNAAMFAGAVQNEDFEAARPKQTSGGVPFLRLDKEDGEWTYGQDDDVVSPETLWAVLPQSLAMGWAAWQGKKIIGKMMANVGQDPIDPTTLPPVSTARGWEENVGAALVCIDGPDDAPIGQMVLFEGTAKGVVDCWNKIFDQLKARAIGGHEDFAPVVALASRSYEHKDWGTVHVPVFKTKSWDVPGELVADYGEPPAIENKTADDQNAQSEKPKAVSRRKKADPKPKVEEPEAEIVDAEVVDETPPETQAAAPEAEVVDEAPGDDAPASKPRRRRRPAAAA